MSMDCPSGISMDDAIIIRWTRTALPPHNPGMKTLPSTRFSARFGLEHPIALAPMALASGGALAAACAQAGALGLVGGGYGELDWTRTQYTLAVQAAAATQRIGCGFITWKLDE